ncbi:MAG: hypothetical protein E6Q85_04990 [Thiothrix sp.]|nr:MAG: hypothetical protein E6Q85_04990 [Thiothrix sp.]
MLKPAPSLMLFVWLGSALFLTACQDDPAKSLQITQDLKVPERASATYITDQVNIAGQALSLWFDTGRCQLQAQHPKLKIEPIWLKTKAPCYFIKSPGTDTVQVYQRDKTSRVLAIVGTPTQDSSDDKRCGTEVEGVVIDASGKMRPSNALHSALKLCADQGLDNAQYEIFARD